MPTLLKPLNALLKEIDYGFAGDVTKVNADQIHKLLQADFIPVFCAITHNKNGQLLNTNADTITSELAIALSEFFEVTINYCFELKGVLTDINDKNSVIPKIDSKYYEQLKSEGIIADGMLPKMENCYNALNNGVHQVNIGNKSLFEKENTNYTSLVL